MLSVLSSSEEFEDIQQREQESRELKQLLDQGACPCEIKVTINISSTVGSLLDFYRRVARKLRRKSIF